MSPVLLVLPYVSIAHQIRSRTFGLYPALLSLVHFQPAFFSLPPSSSVICPSVPRTRNVSHYIPRPIRKEDTDMYMRTEK